MRILAHEHTNSWFNHLALIIGSGLIIAFFSELFFLNEGPTLDIISRFSHPESLIGLTVELSFWYSLFALWLLVPIALFNVRNRWAFFLAASVCGWAIEGLVIPVMYTDVPFSLVWPSLGWHVLVDIFIGWWFLRKILQKNNYLLTATIATCLGLFWGFWATWFWDGGEFPPIKPDSFTIFTFAATMLLIIGYVFVDRLGGTDFKPTRIEIIVPLLFSILVWAVANIAVTPLQMLFPILVFAVFTSLRRNQKTETQPNILNTFTGTVRLPNLGLLLLMPGVASITYPYYFNHAIGFTEIWILLWPMLIVSIVMFSLSFMKIQSARKLKSVSEDL
ncbi:MAG: hypothetical protein D6737_16005 [Chloroflexi bacterium]|nr:MAG: hypothetical protein CUN54_08360 [Phototrophicales bacterium]RMF78052.1 MAG: hypothetical protein D6737_16005 [Chloroflexota bacterium]